MKFCPPFLRPAVVCCVLGLVCQAHAADEVIARAGSTELQAADVAASIAHLSKEEKESLLVNTEALSQLVRSLLVQQLVVKEATDKGWDRQKSIVQQLERVRQSAIAETYLNSLSTPPESYPSEAEVREAYETNKASFFVPKSFRLAQIYIDNKPDEKTASARLALVQEALKAPKADFAALAREHSQEATSAARGGEIGWLTEDQIQPEIRAELPALQLNVVSAPLKLTDGWHILKVMDIKEASTPTLDQVKPLIVRQLRAAKTKANSDAYLADLLKTHPVAINELALPKALAAQGQ